MDIDQLNAVVRQALASGTYQQAICMTAEADRIIAQLRRRTTVVRKPGTYVLILREICSDHMASRYRLIMSAVSCHMSRCVTTASGYFFWNHADDFCTLWPYEIQRNFSGGWAPRYSYSSQLMLNTSGF